MENKGEVCPPNQRTRKPIELRIRAVTKEARTRVSLESHRRFFAALAYDWAQTRRMGQSHSEILHKACMCKNRHRKQRLTALDPFFIHDSASALFATDGLLASDLVVLSALCCNDIQRLRTHVALSFWIGMNQTHQHTGSWASGPSRPPTVTCCPRLIRQTMVLRP